MKPTIEQMQLINKPEVLGYANLLSQYVRKAAIATLPEASPDSLPEIYFVESQPEPAVYKEITGAPTQVRISLASLLEEALDFDFDDDLITRINEISTLVLLHTLHVSSILVGFFTSVEAVSTMNEIDITRIQAQIIISAHEEFRQAHGVFRS